MLVSAVESIVFVDTVLTWDSRLLRLDPRRLRFIVRSARR
jgi:hypothetical protein